MKLTIQLKLLPTDDQRVSLLAAIERFNEAATFAAEAGFKAGVFSRPSIHKIVYREIRDRYGLSAQMAVRAIGKAVEAFKTLKAKGRKECPVFSPRGAITYDERILDFKGIDRVSMMTLSGRALIPMVFGEYQAERFDRLKGQVDLVYRGSEFYLYATTDVPEDPAREINGFLGVDLGIACLAADSDGTTYTGDDVERCRRRHIRNRRTLQRKGTKGAKKRLKKLAGREARFRKHVNHCISKKIVTLAKDTDRGIAVEDLTGIRDRTTVRANQRAKHSGWAFHQLRSFLEYKAGLAGIPVVAINPRNTSRTCSSCGYCDKANRRSQSEFRCLQCGHSSNADFNAALNIKAWATRKMASKLAAVDPGFGPGRGQPEILAL